MKALPFLITVSAMLLSTPAVCHTQDFSGPRLELAAGYDNLSSDGRYEDFPSRLKGAHARLGVGYDLALTQRLIVGLEASVGATTGAKKTVTLASDQFSFRPGRDIDVLARIGYQATPRTLVYAKAGWANASVKLVQRELVGNSQYETTTEHARDDGFRVGLGLEQRLTRSLYAKAEYRFTNFGGGYAYQPGTERHQLLLGAGVRF